MPERNQVASARDAVRSLGEDSDWVASQGNLGGVFLRSGKGIGRLLLNWGILLSVIAAVLAFRYHAEAEADAPLPAYPAHLSEPQIRQWKAFPRYTGTVPVLLYHGINTKNESYSVTPRLFAEQMLALKLAGFHAITLAQYANFVHGDRRDMPSKPILLTFDDGRRDAYRAADDILNDYGFHATMFTFAAWPVTNPGFSLTWSELQGLQRGGTWSVQEHGGRGHEYTVYNAAGAQGGIYAFLRYIPGSPGHVGHLESFRSFVQRVTSDIQWGMYQFATHIPRYRPLAFAVPYANYGQQQTNDSQIPRFMLPWLTQHFKVIFGGDYLDRGPRRPYQPRGRLSHDFAYRMTMDSKTSLPALYCRLKDWVTRAPIWKEYRCLRPGLGIEGRGTRPKDWYEGKPMYSPTRRVAPTQFVAPPLRRRTSRAG